MLRVINNITGAILGVALICGVIWIRVVDSAAHKMFFGYVTRSTATNSTGANDALLIYPIIGMFVGGVLVTIIIFVSSRRNKRRTKIGADTTNLVWIMLAVFASRLQVVPFTATTRLTTTTRRSPRPVL